MTSTPLDRDGQPAASVNWHRNLAKSTSALLGLCTGLIADRVLTNDEIALLDTWLADNGDVAASWPGDAIAGRLREILADGIVTEEERADLFDTLSRLVGGTLEEHGAASGMATRFGIDAPASIEINGRVFCFTGKFIYGPRARCEKAILERGGRALDNVTRQLDYLVIGTLASRDWAHTSHGRKIEKAHELRANGHAVLVVAEEAWVTQLSGE